MYYNGHSIFKILCNGFMLANFNVVFYIVNDFIFRYRPNIIVPNLLKKLSLSFTTI